MADQFGRDIKKRIKASASILQRNTPQFKTGVISYGTNVTKSLLYSGRDAVVKGLLPNLFDTYDVNKGLISDVAQVIKNPRSMGSKFAIIDNDVAKELNTLAKNALNDLKTGKFYDSARDRSSFGMETAALLDEFAGFDMDFDEDGNVGGDSGSNADIKAQREIAEVQEDNADVRTRASISALGQSTEAIISSQETIHKSDIKMRVVQHTQTMTGIGNLLTANAAMLDTQVASFNNIATSLNTLTQTMADKMDNMIGLLTEIRDSSKPATNQNSATRRDDSDIPISSRGIIDIKKYVKSVYKNTDNTFGISNAVNLMTMGLSPKELIDMYKSNPLQFVVDRTIQMIIPTTTKQIASQLNKSIGGFFSSLLLKLNKNKDKEGFWGYMGKMFGMDISSRNSVDLSTYNKGEIKLNGKMEKAITEIIPTELRMIREALTGEKSKAFNYDTGMYEDAFQKLEDYQRQLTDLTRHMSETTAYFNKRMSSMTFVGGGKEVFDKDLNRFLQAVAEKGVYLNPKFKPSDLGISFENKQSEELIRAMLKRTPRSTLQKMNQEIPMAHKGRNDSNFRVQNELQSAGLSTLFNGGDSHMEKARDDYKSGKKYDSKYLEDVNKNLKGLSATNRILEDIHLLLRRGIVVFSGGRGKDGSGTFSEAMNDSRSAYNFIDNKKRSEQDDEIRKRRNYDQERTSASNRLLSDGRLNFDPSVNIPEDVWSRYFLEIDNDVKAKENAANKKAQENSMAYKLGKKMFGGKDGNNGLFESIRTAVNNPFKLVNDAMVSLDRGLFKVIYGDDADEFINDEGEFESSKASGLFGHVSNMLSGQFSKLGDMFKKAIWDDESVLRRNYIKGRDWAEGKVKGAGKRAFKYFADPMADAYKNKATLDEMNASGIDPGLNLRQGIGYEAAKLKSKIGAFDKDVFKDFKSSFKNRKDITDESGLSFGQKMGLKAGRGLDSVMNDFKSFMLGDDFIDEDGNVQKTRSKKIWEDVSKEFSGFLPKGIVYGGAGLAATSGFGLLTGMMIPGGPIFGALIGSTIGFVQHSEKFKEYLFGNNIDGEGHKDGVIDKQVVDGFKKYFPKVATGTIVGSIANSGILGTAFLPGGPIVGALFGGISGMIAANDELKKLMFGELGDNDSGLLSKNTRKDLLESIGFGAGGFLAGKMAAGALSQFGILGSIALPGGPLLAPILGGIGAVFAKDKIKSFFFGTDEKDEKGNKIRKGIFADAFDFSKKELFDPFIGWINKSGASVNKWFQESIMDNFREGMQPFKDEMGKHRKAIGESIGNIGNYMKDGINNVFVEFLGRPLGEVVKEKITDPLKAVLASLSGAVGKFMGAVISSPFRLLHSIGTGQPMFADERGKAKYEKRLNKLAKKDQKDADNMVKSEARNKRMTNRKNSFLVWMSGFLPGAAGLSEDGLSAVDALDSGLSDGSTIETDDSENTPMTRRQRKNEERLAKMREKNERNSVKREARAMTRAQKAKEKADRKASVRERENSRLDELLVKRDKEAKLREYDSDNKLYSDKTDGKKDVDFYKTRKFKNSILSIMKNTKTLADDLKGQLNGVGYNLAYIRNILLAKLGSDGVSTPDGEEKLGYKKPKSKLGKFISAAKDAIGGKFNSAKDATFDYISEKFGWVKKPWNFIRDVVGGGLDALGAVKDGAVFVGKAIKETFGLIGPGLKEGITEMLAGAGSAFRMGLESLGEIALGAGQAIGSFSEYVGTFAGQLMTSLGDGLNVLTSGISAFATTAFELLKTVGVDIAKGIWEGGKAIGAGAWAGVKGAATYLVRGKEEAVRVKTKYLGKVFVDGGHLGLEGFKAKDSFGRMSELNLVNLLFGKPIGEMPTKALPVYVVNNKLSTDAKETVTDDIVGNVVSDAIDDTSDANDVTKPGFFKKFTKAFKGHYKSLRGDKDLDKSINKLVEKTGSDAELESVNLVIQKETLNEIRELKGGISGDPKKPGGGILSMLSGFMGGMLPLLGTIVSALSGNGERIAINILKKSPKLREMAKGAFKSTWNFITDSKLYKGTVGKGVNVLRSKFASSTIEQVGKDGVNKLAAEAVEKYATAGMSNGAKKELASRIALEASQNLGSKSAVNAIDTLAKKSISAIGGKSGGKITAKMITSSAGKNAITSAASTVVDKGLISQIISKLKSFLLSDAVINKIGGPKMKAAMAKVATAISEKFNKVAAEKLTKGIAGKILAKLGGPLFLLYDLSTGMMEAGNIFHVKDSAVTWKMRITAGISKMVSGILFGLLFDDFLAELIFPLWGSIEERDAISASKSELSREKDEYNAANGTSYTLDDYNDKVANKRVFTKVIDTITAPFKGTGNPMENLLSNTLSSIDATLKTLAPILDNLTGWIGAAPARGNSKVEYGWGPGKAKFNPSTGKLPTFKSAMTAGKQVSPTRTENGLYVYQQSDPRWAGFKYGSGNTIGEAGCAPTIAATLISNYDQRIKISPADAAAFAERGGFKLPNNGTDIKFFAAIAKQYKIKVTMGIKHPEMIISQLKSGRPVIVMGKRGSNESAYSGREMHYMLLMAYDQSLGKVAVMDPASPGVKHLDIGAILKDTVSVLYTDGGGKGMGAKYVPVAKDTQAQTVYGPVKTGYKGSIAASAKEFIGKIAGGAISGFQKFGVLPSLTIAQGILESGFGKSAIGNNIFGIKAHKGWDGMKQLVPTTEFVNGVKQKVSAFFRDYPSVNASIEDHAKLLSGSRYKSVISAKNYKDAAIAVQKSGYATDPKYASKLINIIEKYGLNQYDGPAVGRGEPSQMPTGKSSGKAIPSMRNGVFYYNQTDPAFINSSNGKDIIESGCGPIAAAMVIKSYGYDLDPVQAHAFALKGGFKQRGGGTNIAFFSEIAKKYGIIMEPKTPNVKAILKQLSEKKPVILLGQDNTKTLAGGHASRISTSSPFSEIPHYVVLTSIAKDGSINVLDPLGKKSGAYQLTILVARAQKAIFSSAKNNRGIDPGQNEINFAKSKYYKALMEKSNIPTTAAGAVLETADTSEYGTFDEYSKPQGMNYGGGVFDSLTFITDMMQGMVDVKYGFSSVGEVISRMTGADTGDSKTIGGGKTGIAYSGNSKYLTGKTNMHGFFGDLLEKLAVNKKKSLNITSGYRTKQEQIALWNDRDTKYDKKDANGNITNDYVANPYTGLSYHQMGLAADIDSSWFKKLSNKELSPFGLFKPMAHEPWHVQPLNTQSISRSEAASTYGVPVSKDSYKDSKLEEKLAGKGGDVTYSEVKKMNQNIQKAKASSAQTQQVKNVETLAKVVSSGGQSAGIPQVMLELFSEMVQVLKSIDRNTANPTVIATATSGGDAPNVAVVQNTGGSSVSNVSAGQRTIDKLTSR